MAVVNDNGEVAARKEEREHDVRANVAEATGDENALQCQLCALRGECGMGPGEVAHLELGVAGHGCGCLWGWVGRVCC